MNTPKDRPFWEECGEEELHRVHNRQLFKEAEEIFGVKIVERSMYHDSSLMRSESTFDHVFGFY